MTPQEIQKINDRLAREVRGWHIHQYQTGGAMWCGSIDNPVQIMIYGKWDPFTDIKQAMECKDKIVEAKCMSFELHCSPTIKSQAIFNHIGKKKIYRDAWGDTDAAAICLAIIKVLDAEKEKSHEPR